MTSTLQEQLQVEKQSMLAKIKEILKHQAEANQAQMMELAEFNKMTEKEEEFLGEKRQEEFKEQEDSMRIMDKEGTVRKHTDVKQVKGYLKEIEEDGDREKKEDDKITDKRERQGGAEIVTTEQTEPAQSEHHKLKSILKHSNNFQILVKDMPKEKKKEVFSDSDEEVRK